MLQKNLNYLVEKNEITVKVFAKRLGVSYAKAISYLKGSQMKFELLVNISEIFKVSCDDLLKKDLSKEENVRVGFVKNRESPEKENPNLEIEFLKDKCILYLEEIRELNKKYQSVLDKNNPPNFSNPIFIPTNETLEEEEEEK